MLVAAVDPGLTGACAVIGPQGLLGVFDLPTMEIPGIGPKAKVKRKIDGRTFCKALRAVCPVSEGKPTFVIEAVGTMGGANNAVQTQGSLLRSLGALETVAECMGWPVIYVQPLTWKRRFGLIDSKLNDRERKAKSLDVARRLYPACRDLGRVKDHNRAESVLIAHHARMELA